MIEPSEGHTDPFMELSSVSVLEEVGRSEKRREPKKPLSFAAVPLPPVVRRRGGRRDRGRTVLLL